MTYAAPDCTKTHSKAALDAPPKRTKPLTAPEDRGPPRVGALARIGEVRHEAARLYRAARRGEVEAADASKLANVLSLIVRCLEGGELEQRMAAIEGRLTEKETRR